MGRSLSLLVLGISLCLTALAAANLRFVDTGADFPLPLDSYHDQGIPSLVGKLAGRIEKEPLNLVATIIFFAAIAHTFLVAKFRRISYRYQQAYQAIEYLLHEPQSSPDPGTGHEKLIFRAQFFHFMGEVEAVFGIWLVPLFAAIIVFHGWPTMVEYVGNVSVSDAIFVVVIVASGRPIPSQSMEVKLPITTRIKIRFHYLICIWCYRYGKQLDALRKIASSLPEHVDDCSPETLPDSSKERMKQVLRETLHE